MARPEVSSASEIRKRGGGNLSEIASADHTNNPAAAPTPGTVVPCPLKRSQIAVGRCVEYQQENGCHCEHALTSLRFVRRKLDEDDSSREAGFQERRAEKLDEIRELTARAEQIEAARPPKSIEKKPAPPPEEKKPMPVTYSQNRKCSNEGCGRVIADQSKTGICVPCNQGYKPGSEKAAAHAAKIRKPIGAPRGAPVLPESARKVFRDGKVIKNSAGTIDDVAKKHVAAPAPTPAKVDEIAAMARISTEFKALSQPAQRFLLEHFAAFTG